ncbi:MAG: T9SS type A sorting domain-containing protein [Syntrophomonadaceae bacterium]
MKTLCLIIAVFFAAGFQLGQVRDKAPVLPVNEPSFSKAYDQSLGNHGTTGSEKSIWDIKLLWDMKSVTKNLGHAGIVYLNTSGDVWISRWNSDTLFVWTATTTNYIYTITIPGVTGVRAMTFDGENIYAGNNSTDIYVINPGTRSLKGTIQAPQTVRYITYDPKADGGNGGFWIGNFSTDPQLISRTGSVLRTITHSDLGTTGIYGAAYDGETSGGPYLWFFGQGDGYGSPQVISQVSVSTGKSTTLQHPVSYDLETYAASMGIYANADSMLAGGLCLVTGIFPGIVTLGGIMQGEPDLIFAIEIGTTAAPPAQISISRTFSFGDPKVSSSYKILSLPGDVSIPLSQLFADAGEHKKNWNAFYDNGKAENYLVEYDNSAAFTFKPGSAFWAVSKNALNISAQVNPVTTDGLGMYEIPLHSGWNLISNPFTSEISWGSVKLANQLAANSLIYAWNGSWSNPASLSPYEGYYFNNLNNLASLKLTESIPVGISASGLNKSTLYNPDNYIKGYLYSDGKEFSPFYISIDKRSTDGFDEFDYFTPPSDFSDECIYILNKNLQTDYKHLFIDSRPEISDGQSYDLVLKNALKKDCEIRFTGMENFEGYEIFLLDKGMKRFYNLRENSIVRIESAPVKQEFSLLIGKTSFIEEKKGITLPKEFALFQNYPNPFNPYTIISYELPSKNRVELKVFSVLGKEIAILTDDIEEPGRHEVKFEAKSLPSGIYFCTIRSGSFTKTQKMVLLK